VSDLADAHLLALNTLDESSQVFNLGNGRGCTVRQIVASVSRLMGRPLEPVIAPRRAGDPPILIASSNRIVDKTGWAPRFADIDHIIQTALAWHSSHPNGYDDRLMTS
jgi:UDP-glucose 4-epimerase